MQETNSVMENEGFDPVDMEDSYSEDELYGDDEQQDDPEQTEDTPGGAQAAEKQGQKENQSFATEARRIRDQISREYESHPAFIAGIRLLNDLMQRQGVTDIQQAARMAEDNYIKAIAEREGVSEYVARSMLMQQQRPVQHASDMNSRAAQIRAEISTLDMPEGFDFQEAVKDEAFAQMLLDYPTGAAVQIYHMQKQMEQANQRAAQAPQAVADKLRARQAIPQSLKPQQPANPQYDPYALTDDQVLQMRLQRRRNR